MEIRRQMAWLALALGLLGPMQAARAQDEQCRQIQQRHSSGQQSATAENEMAFCAAREGRVDEAFARLEKALAMGLRDYRLVAEDEDYLPLRRDPRWPLLLQRLAQAEQAYLKTINTELKALHDADQADRRQAAIDWEVVGRRDDQRRARVLELAEQGQLKVAADYYHAAMVMQHGSKPDDYAKAMQWARQAWQLDPHHSGARWLSAAAEDRYLHSLDKPQVWGTQYRKPEGQDRWTQEPFDRQAKTDTEREAMGVPPLAQSEQRLERMNGHATR